MRIQSDAFENFTHIPDKFTCDGENVSPPLRILEVPENAQELALIVEDPDAPGGNWVHWIVYSINPNTTFIAEDTIPINSMVGINTGGEERYEGPCPPSSMHRYVFKLYVLNRKIGLKNNVNKSDLENAMKGAILEKATLTGLYKRK